MPVVGVSFWGGREQGNKSLCMICFEGSAADSMSVFSLAEWNI